jgi:hypothetical protein
MGLGELAVQVDVSDDDDDSTIGAEHSSAAASSAIDVPQRTKKRRRCAGIDISMAPIQDLLPVTPKKEKGDLGEG